MLADEDDVVRVSGELESEERWLVFVPKSETLLPPRVDEPVVDEEEEDDDEEMAESSGGVEADDDESKLCELSRAVESIRRLLTSISSLLLPP